MTIDLDEAEKQMLVYLLARIRYASQIGKKSATIPLISARNSLPSQKIAVANQLLLKLSKER